ncbi:hypothetical protein B0H10DRAFT_1941425 [Mycena sp. CBHHK59/15]|nr:hypothetical protein B0H10DRAFT_1941425 [Mycena sp. CBHHK59/15]
MASAVHAPTLPQGNHPFYGHMRQGQAIFGVHYGDPQFMLNIPKPVNAPSPHPASVDGEFLRPTWVSPTMSYLILLPHFNPFYGPLFKCLNYTKETRPVQISTCKGWKFGNSWHDAVIAKSGVHLQWFADLKASAVGDLNIGRVSRIIDLSLHNDPVLTGRSKLEFLLDLVVGSLPVPLYFHWGIIDSMPYFPVPKILEEMKLVPDQQKIAYLNGLLGTIACSPWALDSADTISMHSLRDSHPYRADPHAAMINPHDTDISNQTGTFPPVKKHSGQKDGKDMHAFFAQRKNLNEKQAEMENPSMKTRHLAPRQTCGQIILLTNTCMTVLKTNGIFALTPAEEPENDDDDEPDEALDNDLEDQFPEFPDGLTSLLPDDQLGEHSTADDLECSHDLSKDKTSVDTLYEPYHDMSEIPYCRFGFTEPSGSIQYTENLRADHCCKALGDEHWPLLQQTPKQHVPALLAFISAAKSIHDVPKELLDLRQEGAESPRGHAARFTGGIISCLARQVVNDDIACLGPTADVFNNGEIDLICGVYQVATGQHDTGTEDGMQKTNVSWWPKPVAWHASGFNTGWWSPDCESVLLTQTQWKHNIRFVQKSRTIGLANERIAAEFLMNY